MSKKKFIDRWREKSADGTVHRQKKFESKGERDAHRARRVLSHNESAAQGSSMPFSALGKLWLEDHCRHNKAAGQYGQDSRLIDGYLNPAFGTVQLKDLRRSHLASLKLALQSGQTLSKGQIKPKSINNVLGLAKAMLTFATKYGEPPLLAANPFTSVVPASVNSQPYAYWTVQERDRFLTFCKNVDPQFAEVVLVACHTGLRRGELAGLQRRHLNFDLRQITVMETYCYMTRSRQHRTKNRRLGWVAMNDAVMDALKDRTLMSMDAPIFDPGLIEFGSDKLRRYCAKFGVRPIRFHDLRHTFASTLVMAGVPIYDVQRLLRHETSKMTERYAHLSPEHLTSAAQAICARTVRAEAPAEANVVNFKK